MSSLRRTTAGLLYCSLVMVCALGLQGQTITPQGGEFGLLESGFLRGDQTNPHLSLTPNGGYVVWQDNSIDGNGLGIGARWIDSSFSPSVFGSFRVNQQAAGEQQHPQVATFANGAAAIVWQGGALDHENIFIRFLSPNHTFTSGSDLQVNVYTGGAQINPVLAILPSGVLAVAWASKDQDGSMQGVFGRLVNTNGQFLSSPFQVNQFTNYNQRNPAIAALSSGSFLVAWVSEQQRLLNTTDIMGRLYNSNGQALSDEFRISATNGLCAAPAVAAVGAGFGVAWSQKTSAGTEGWDIFGRALAGDGSSPNPPLLVNSFTDGDQFAPKVSAIGTNQLVVWTSLAEDGSYEGVYGRLLYDGMPSGDAFLVNTTTLGKQFEPVVSSDNSNRFLVAWSGYTDVNSGFDLFAQRYASGAPLPTPAAPFASALSSAKISVAWPSLAGYPLAYYEIYLDAAPVGSPTATVTNGNYWVATGFAPGSSHTFRLAYMFAGNVRSALSATATGTTWGEDADGPNGVPDGLPDDWQAHFWGPKSDGWPPAGEDSDGDGVSNLREFLAGTNPLDPNSVLKMRVTWNRLGRTLNWNTQPGLVYQVQVSTDLRTWSNLGAPRFAAGTTDSQPINGGQVAEYFRVLRLR